MGSVNFIKTLIIEPCVKSICPKRAFILSENDMFFVELCVCIGCVLRLAYRDVSTEIALYLS